MINGAHIVLYADDAKAARQFLKETLELDNVDAGDGWLIFALPPAELAAHPVTDGNGAGRASLYLMCEDIEMTIESLKRKGASFTQPVSDQGWGLLTSLRIPGAGEIGLYQPKHAKPSE